MDYNSWLPWTTPLKPISTVSLHHAMPCQRCQHCCRPRDYDGSLTWGETSLSRGKARQKQRPPLSSIFVDTQKIGRGKSGGASTAATPGWQAPQQLPAEPRLSESFTDHPGDQQLHNEVQADPNFSTPTHESQQILHEATALQVPVVALPLLQEMRSPATYSRAPPLKQLTLHPFFYWFWHCPLIVRTLATGSLGDSVMCVPGTSVHIPIPSCTSLQRYLDTATIWLGTNGAVVNWRDGMLRNVSSPSHI